MGSYPTDRTPGRSADPRYPTSRNTSRAVCPADRYRGWLPCLGGCTCWLSRQPRHFANLISLVPRHSGVQAGVVSQVRDEAVNRLKSSGGRELRELDPKTLSITVVDIEFTRRRACVWFVSS